MSMYAFFSFFGKIIDTLMKRLYPQQAPVSPATPLPAPISNITATPVSPPVASHAMLETFCHAIETFEGGPGDPNHINNNPGDFRCSPVGYLPKYGDVKCSAHNFAIFPTYQLGWEYLLASVHYRATLHPTWTILDFFNNYAPSSDNNPTLKYATFVANRCGVPITCTLAKLFS